MPFNLPFLPTINNQKMSGFEKDVSSIWGSIKNIYSMLNVEVRHHDLKQDAFNLSQVANAFELTDIDAGITGSRRGEIDEGHRDGDKIRVRSIHVKGQINQSSSNAYSQTVNLYLVKHYDNFLGNAFSFDQMFDSTTGTVPTCRLRNTEYQRQYKILASRKFQLGTGLDNLDGNRHAFDIYLKPKKRSGTSVEWEGTLGSDPSNGKYYLVAVSDSSGSGGQASIYFASRVTYVDN